MQGTLAMPLVDPKQKQQLYWVAGYGFVLVTYVIAGLILGWVFETYLGFGSYGYVLFVVLGFTLGVYRLIEGLKSQRAKDEGEG
jgi:F0F1-type ATP synthase assembly protein I